MKANEVRIGNLVYRNGKPITVNAKTILAMANCGGIYYVGIPATTERLKEMKISLDAIIGPGFGTQHTTFIGFNICHEDKQFYYTASIEDFIKRFKSVHQLQNLYFALTGEELKIKEKES